MLFVSRGGPIVIDPSTKIFTASPLFGASPSVSTWKVIAPIVKSAAACPVTVPALFEVNVTLHDPAIVPGFEAHVLLETIARAPFVLVRVTVTGVPSGAGFGAPPVSWNTVTVKVWG